MIGQEQILRVRMKGGKPTAVFVRAGMPTMPVLSKYDNLENALRIGVLPTVDIPDEELGKRLDMRFLAGLRVHIHGAEMSDRFMDLVDAVAAVAEHVIVLAGADLMEYKQGAWRVWTS